MERFLVALNTADEIRSFVDRLDVQHEPLSATELQEIIRFLDQLRGIANRLRRQATSPRNLVDAGDLKRLREDRRKFDQLDALISRKIEQAENGYCRLVQED
ncbi:hypothetical protein F4774DRAFT_355222 [Daldinia eschscholtzii]|nr:hypothetical protein F4774DRAFT_355222 [Daldinia eschscholtzii]